MQQAAVQAAQAVQGNRNVSSTCNKTQVLSSVLLLYFFKLNFNYIFLKENISLVLSTFN